MIMIRDTVVVIGALFTAAAAGIFFYATRYLSPKFDRGLIQTLEIVLYVVGCLSAVMNGTGFILTCNIDNDSRVEEPSEI